MSELTVAQSTDRELLGATPSPEELLREQFNDLLAEIDGRNKGIRDDLPTQPPIVSDSFIPKGSMAVVGIGYAGYATEMFDGGDLRSDSPYVDDEYYVPLELREQLVIMMREQDSEWDDLHPERELNPGELSRQLTYLGRIAGHQLR